MSDFEDSEEEMRDLQPRFKILYVAIALTLLILFLRLWYLQIMEGDELREFSEKNRVKETKIRAQRGLILDRDLKILVDNVTGFDATITPQYATELEDTAVAVGKILSIPSSTIIDMVKASRRKSGSFVPTIIKENLSLDEVFRLKRIRISHPGLNVDNTILRYYPMEQNGAQLFGYVGEISRKQLVTYNQKNLGKTFLQQGDIIGQSGLEEQWDDELRGRDGLSFIEVDAHGREASTTQNKAFLELKPQPPTPGKNIILTIDKDLQEVALKALLEQNDKTGPRIGSLVAMKTNGEILAWVNTPSFNPNRFSRGISTDVWSKLINDPFKPLRNKVIQDHFAPGSTLKPIVALAALQENVITPSTIISAPGQMRFGNRTYHDSLRGGHGDITVLRAIESSSNIFFYKMGIQLGIDKIEKYARILGLGEKTGIQLNNEVSGNFPTADWKLRVKGEPWQPGENLSNAIGQGFVLTNLLQMTLAYNTVATGGKRYKPMLVKRIVDNDNKIVSEFEPTVVRDITVSDKNGVFIANKHIRTVQEAMRRVANGDHGTARWWRIPGVEMAGKTGTSQVMSFTADDIYKKCENRPILQRHHGSYFAYAPADDPQIIVGVLAEHACHGNTGASPIVRDVIRAYIQKYHPSWIKSSAVRPAVEKSIPEPEELIE